MWIQLIEKDLFVNQRVGDVEPPGMWDHPVEWGHVAHFTMGVRSNSIVVDEWTRCSSININWW